MAAPEGYRNPFDLGERGIERLSVVYGVVPVHADGTPMKEHALHVSKDELAEPSTLRKVAKGMVASTTRLKRNGLMEDVKVAWQSSALARPTLSRGVTRWPLTHEIYTPKEVEEAIVESACIDDGEFPTGSPDTSTLVEDLDAQLEQPLTNFLLAGVLQATSRVNQAEIYLTARQAAI